MSENADPVMTPAEVSAYLQVPEATVEKWRYIRTGPDYMHVGRHVRYRRSSVDAWLDTLSRAKTG